MNKMLTLPSCLSTTLVQRDQRHIVAKGNFLGLPSWRIKKFKESSERYKIYSIRVTKVQKDSKRQKKVEEGSICLKYD